MGDAKFTFVIARGLLVKISLVITPPQLNNNFLVQFILNLLPSEYGMFQMRYNTMKDKMDVSELHIMLVQEETRLKNQRSHLVHYVSHQGNQGARNNVMKNHDKGMGLLKFNRVSV